MMIDPPSVCVIIPVYNTEPYLTECLDSVVKQSGRDIEIIIVNDGSTDGSAAIIDRYAASDDRIRTVEKQHGGVAAARNDAIRIASAEFLMFLDSDDMFAPGAIERVLERIRGTGCDILIFNGRSFSDDSLTRRWSNEWYFDLDESDQNRVDTGLSWVERSGGRILQSGMKIYRRSYIIETGCRFGDTPIGEDFYFFYTSMIPARSVGYLHFAGYFRRYRPGSLMTGSFSRGTEARIRSFREIASTMDLLCRDEDRRIVATQYALYACVLWIRAVVQPGADARKALLGVFADACLHRFIGENQYDWKLTILYAVISLPAVFWPLQVLWARSIQWTFQSRTRLL